FPTPEGCGPSQPLKAIKAPTSDTSFVPTEQSFHRPARRRGTGALQILIEASIVAPAFGGLRSLAAVEGNKGTNIGHILCPDRTNLPPPGPAPRDRAPPTLHEAFPIPSRPWRAAVPRSR